MKHILYIFIIGLFVSSCGKEQAETDQEIIDSYIAEQGLQNVQVTPEGIHYIITDEGTGEKPKIDDLVTVHYRGYLTTGEEFDTSYDGTPITFSLFQVVPGWRIGIPKFSRGGGGTLIIPSEYGYGEEPPSNNDIIGKNEVLVFDIEVIDFE